MCEEKVQKYKVIVPNVIAIDESVTSKKCNYGEFYISAEGVHTYLDLLPRDMYTNLFARYICSRDGDVKLNTFQLSMAPVPVMDCTDGARPYISGTVVIRGKCYCYKHSYRVCPQPKQGVATSSTHL